MKTLKLVDNLINSIAPELPICPDCGGDGIETCTNPDHGFIDGVGGETYRLGCPLCGHSDKHKIKGSQCPSCNGTGITNQH